MEILTINQLYRMIRFTQFLKRNLMAEVIITPPSGDLSPSPEKVTRKSDNFASGVAENQFLFIDLKFFREMATAGCRPVDMYKYNNLVDRIGGGSTLAFQSAVSIAAALMAAFDNDDAVAARPATQMRTRTLAWESDAIISKLPRIFEGLSDTGWIPRPSYDDDPVLATTDNTPVARGFCLQQRAAAMAV